MLSFRRNNCLKKSTKISSCLTWRHDVKCRLCVIIRTYKMNISLQLPLRSSHSGMFSKNNCPWKQPCHLELLYNTAVLNLRSNSLQNTCDRVQLLVKLYVTNAFLLLTTVAEELYFIVSFCWTTSFVEHLLKAASMFWKAAENFRQTSGIIIQSLSFTLKETCAESLIFWRNKKAKRIILNCMLLSSPVRISE